MFSEGQGSDAQTENWKEKVLNTHLNNHFLEDTYFTKISSECLSGSSRSIATLMTSVVELPLGKRGLIFNGSHIWEEAKHSDWLESGCGLCPWWVAPKATKLESHKRLSLVKSGTPSSRSGTPSSGHIPWMCSQDVSLNGAQARRPSFLPQTHCSPLPRAEILHPPTISHFAHVSFVSSCFRNSEHLSLPFLLSLKSNLSPSSVDYWLKQILDFPKLVLISFLEQTIFIKYLQCTSLLLISEYLMNLPRLQNTCM